MDYTNSELNNYIKSIRKNVSDLLTRKEEISLTKKARRGDTDAKNRLFYANLRLVILIAKKYIRRDINLLDLVQEGNIGLLKAIQKFDYHKRFKFSTYAFWWIRHYIQKYLYNNHRNIPIPVKKEEFLRRIERTFIELEKKNNTRPSHDEVAEEMNESPAKVGYVMNIAQPVLSIDKEIGPENPQKMQEIIMTDSKWDTENVVNNCLMKQDINRALENLMEIEKKIIMYRFGFFNGVKYTLKETGDIFKSSPETIRRIELSVLEKIKKNNIGLRNYIQ